MNPFVLIIGGLLLIIEALVKSFAHKALAKPIIMREPVLFLFAHADDDAMFYVPTIESLKRKSIPFSMVLFSSNETRKQEFQNACKGYGCENSYIADPQTFKDGFQENWDIMKIAQEVQEIVERDGIQTIITFDKNGISGHPNHINLFKALPMIHTLVPHVSLYTLTSKNIIRKYSHTIDCLCSVFLDSIKQDNITTLLESSHEAYEYMKYYPSQLNWYRYLYLFTSTYTMINKLELFNSN
ncbi:N-acetylglucosaminyl-phosphatidylinositol de-N-acetylase, putative [Entamoeba invadens IP1]|uniref:N-acetylglucosaminylphosphatidylinositol deacetylase n=1 Tax=Entamoeba invadens IP1 TaxID=370355 RepID=A0A0A1UGV3_ENTIV|nr:N-acetylglucosaminyl-phosphatidylinositol de-N-acetylase, putative [Entamoeba invadens IP1]ELP95189.1 N-acetylglucosaminyl-phosphatidylinositol de-N-acetylase, putative [Entamoeba invadens IP1]|eukprot:XP_004261960.1 N-acetylglucosaminyl-phosphatidylinositol de-N-acetylase, putative [Entamoeba invadens IP1]